VSGNPLMAVRAGEIQCRCLGAAIDVLDERARPLRDEVGELVLAPPCPRCPSASGTTATGSATERATSTTIPASGATATGHHSQPWIGGPPRRPRRLRGAGQPACVTPAGQRTRLSSSTTCAASP
jgi:hypothetical protein